MKHLMVAGLLQSFLVIPCSTYRVFHRFGKAKFADGGLVLGSSQFTQLP